MNHSSAVSTPPSPRYRSSTAAAAPAVIPLDYSYCKMSPSCYTRALNRPCSIQRCEENVEMDFSETQYSSLFGDPVPPPPPAEFLGSAADEAAFLRSATMDISSEEDNYLSQVQAKYKRLFHTEPYASNATNSRSTTRTSSNLENFDIPCLKPPDIQVLPNSSAGSSSDPLNTPNSYLLRPSDIVNKPAIYENLNSADIDEIVETVVVSDAAGTREYTEAKRRFSNISDDFRSNVGTSCETPVGNTPMLYKMSDSDESHSSADWFRPATRSFPEFSKIPKLRPSSKNVMSIKNNEMPTHYSPVAAMFNDSSSGEERVADYIESKEEMPKSTTEIVPERPPSPSVNNLLDLQLISPQRRPSLLQDTDQNFINVPQTVDPPFIPPVPSLERSLTSESIKRAASPAIRTNLIATGGDHRINTPRLHKNLSFTIIKDKSGKSTAQRRPSSTVSTPSPTKPVAKPRHHLPKKSLSSTQLKLPKIASPNQFTSDDSPRPSVQFDMTGRFTPSRMPKKGILQHRESLSSSQDALPQTPARFLPLPDIHQFNQKYKSCEALPMLTDPYRTAIPRLHRSAFDMSKETAVFPPGALPRPLKPNPNPTRKQRGLLRVLKKDEVISRIPLRNNWSSMDDITMNRFKTGRLTPMALKHRRRSSSTSPERRSSTQTASDRRSSNLSSVTTSDFSFRRPSNASIEQRRRSSVTKPLLPKQRRKSILPINNMGVLPRAKIAKPTTLSPIIGTPNKDSSSPQSPENITMQYRPSSETQSETSRRDSLSKIPVRRGSISSSRLDSRSNSPFKDTNLQIPTSGRSSRTTICPSPSAKRNDSMRDLSRSSSRSVSRASTRPISQVASRTSSRSNSRLDQAKNIQESRSTSRGSNRTVKSVHVSISPDQKRRKSVVAERNAISLSPQVRRPSVARRASISPPKPKVTNRKEQAAIPRTSRSSLPRRASVKDLKAALKTNAVVKSRKSSPIKRKASPKKKEVTSVKKTASSVKKQESSVKRTPSSVGKQQSATKKEPNAAHKSGAGIKQETTKMQNKTTAKREISPTNVKKPNLKTNAKPSDGKSNKTTNNTKSKSNKETVQSVSKNTDKSMPKPDIPTTTEVNGKSAGMNIAANGAVAAAAGAAIATAVVTSASEENNTAEIKKSPSSVSLMRMGSRISLLSNKKPDSSLGSKIREEDIKETNGQETEGTSNQPLTNEVTNKTLENVQKTVTGATEGTPKTKDQSQSELKRLDSDLIKATTPTGIGTGNSTTSSVTTVLEGKTNSELQTKSGDGVLPQKSPMPTGQPIEADVSVINGEKHLNENTERVSERAISALAEVESESANLQNFEMGLTNKEVAAIAASGQELPDAMEPQSDDFKVDAKRRSPDGQGGSTVGSGEK